MIVMFPNNPKLFFENKKRTFKTELYPHKGPSAVFIAFRTLVVFNPDFAVGIVARRRKP